MSRLDPQNLENSTAAQGGASVNRTQMLTASQPGVSSSRVGVAETTLNNLGVGQPLMNGLPGGGVVPQGYNPSSTTAEEHLPHSVAGSVTGTDTMNHVFNVPKPHGLPQTFDNQAVGSLASSLGPISSVRHAGGPFASFSKPHQPLSNVVNSAGLQQQTALPVQNSVDFPAPNVVAPQNPEIPQKLAEFHRTRSGTGEQRAILSPQEIADNMLAQLTSAADSTPSRTSNSLYSGNSPQNQSPSHSGGNLLNGGTLPNTAAPVLEGGHPGSLFKTPLPVNNSHEAFQSHRTGDGVELDEVASNSNGSRSGMPGSSPLLSNHAANQSLSAQNNGIVQKSPEKLSDIQMNGDLNLPNHLDDSSSFMPVSLH